MSLIQGFTAETPGYPLIFLSIASTDVTGTLYIWPGSLMTKLTSGTGFVEKGSLVSQILSAPGVLLGVMEELVYLLFGGHEGQVNNNICIYIYIY